MAVETIVRFSVDQRIGYGLLDGETIKVLAGDIFGEYHESGEQLAANSVKLLAPCEPTKAVCVGLNYRSHAAELDFKVPEEPVLFLKPTTSIIGNNEDVVYWPMIGRLDYEAEIVVVIGKKAHNVEEKDAMDYVFGYTAGNDLTARDLQSKDGQWTRAKGFDTFCSFGPAIVRGIDVSDVKVQSFVNGELKQDGRTSQLIFSVPFLISYISKVMTLLPGDIIMTGTPEGIGPMQVGDTVEIRVENVGSLVNQVVAYK
ncbi:MAG: fumarylacetoacetate hydrolase family protein [Desulfitobacteriaceae bacterium]